MRLMYLKPKLRDLFQGARIAFVRQFRGLTQDEVSSKLGVPGNSKRRTIVRYEKGDRIPKNDRLEDIAKILKVKINSIKQYDFKAPIDTINLSRTLDINHLHLSLRKGVDVLNILENKTLNYNYLSVDVMIHSVEDFIPIIEKYASKIEILFCNTKEYNILKKYIKNIPLVIVTN